MTEDEMGYETMDEMMETRRIDEERDGGTRSRDKASVRENDEI